MALGGLALGGWLVHANPDNAAGDDGVLDEVGVDVRGVRLDVHQHRLRPLIEDAVAERVEAERGRDDLVPLADAEGADKQVRAARAAVYGDRVFPANVVGDGALELCQVRTEGEDTDDSASCTFMVWPVLQVQPGSASERTEGYPA